MTERIAGPVMIVDDDFFIRDLVSTIVRDYGADSVEAGNAKSALALAQQIHPSLVILDVQMPGMDGLKLCRRLRKDGLKAPVFLLTNSTDPSTSYQASLAGITGWLPKPDNPDRLASRLQSVLRKHVQLDKALATITP